MPLRKLELTKSVMGNTSTFHPALIYDDNAAALADTGLPGTFGQLREQVELAGVPLDRLSQVILTHQDIDHIGGLPELAHGREKPLEVRAHAADKPYIDGTKPLIKLNAQRLAALTQGLTDGELARFERMFSPATAPNVNRTLADGDTLDVDGGVVVIHTPGHTPGHVSLYHRRTKTLIAGDAMVVSEGRLMGPAPAMTPDMDSALRSLGKLAAFDIERVLCYHGGWFEGNANDRIAELASGS